MQKAGKKGSFILPKKKRLKPIMSHLERLQTRKPYIWEMLLQTLKKGFFSSKTHSSIFTILPFEW
ncbi:hypothetical protein C3K47_18885 [Solitalea longa]|uniref:Uncharacterized protein n=1 Tax=Solitalea longa TaxID=2079460 RepID=A0A2S4ZWF8_9SPHI|nr:hypothetical protein C3K47_18885 [Solitalea longa]